LLRDLPQRPVYLTSPHTPLGHVARALVARNIECAFVLEGRKVVGVLAWPSLVNALLIRGIQDQADEERELVLEDGPKQVRALILMEHMNIQRLLRDVERGIKHFLVRPVAELRELEALQCAVRRLCQVMSGHFALENRLLGPSLENLDAWGKVRAERLRLEHTEQERMLATFLVEFEQAAQAPEPVTVSLAATVSRLIDCLRKDMQTEEDSLLHAELLRDDPAPSSVELG
jgi:hemerythrin-like domain-containing protein